MQDPSTLLAAHSLDPQPGESVLDLCAAPGGKLTYIAQLVRNEARLVAYDTSANRLKLVEENCKRLGVTCVSFPERDPAGGGTATLSIPPFPAGSYDKILIDAPCSNTGVLRRRVDLRWRIKAQEIARLRQVQSDLLNNAARMLKPGGVLIYSTCSLEPEENEDLVAEFLKSNGGFKMASQRALLPFAENVDGAFVAKLVRR